MIGTMSAMRALLALAGAWSPEQSSSHCWGGGIAVVTGCREWEHQTFISSMVSEKNTVQLLKCAALKKRI